MLWEFFVNLIFGIIARMLCANHLNRFSKTDISSEHAANIIFSAFQSIYSGELSECEWNTERTMSIFNTKKTPTTGCILYRPTTTFLPRLNARKPSGFYAYTVSCYPNRKCINFLISMFYSPALASPGKRNFFKKNVITQRYLEKEM